MDATCSPQATDRGFQKPLELGGQILSCPRLCVHCPPLNGATFIVPPPIQCASVCLFVTQWHNLDAGIWMLVISQGGNRA